ncbi:MAG: PAS domain-containing protein [Methylophilaceae bacterium]|nr:PAS domain-containing protein [Methylophilaceae bacterium]
MAIPPRPTPSGREISLPENAFITSKTDAQGRILYGNRIFVEISGYPEHVLIGAPHNIVRHPDMPRGVFKLLWDTISRGEEFIGYVKNLSADGSHYWVLATVTPDFDRNRAIVGYYSTRRRPRKEAIAAIEPIYAAMRQEESRHSGSRQPQAGVDALMNLIRDKGEKDYADFILAL